MKWKNIRKFLPFIGILIFIYIAIKLDLISIIKEISQVNLFYILLAFLALIIFLTSQTLKWYSIARFQKIKFPFLKAWKIDLMSSFYGFITPSKIGNIMRADYIKKYSGSLGKGAGNFVLEKTLDLVALFVIAIFFGFVFRKQFSLISLQYYLIFLTLLLIGFFIFINKTRAKKLLKIFYKLLPKSLQEKAKITFNNFYQDMPKKRYLFLALLINISSWIFMYFVTYLVGLSLGINIPFIYFLAILPISTLVALIPITVSGFGTREATLIGLFSLFNVSAVKVFSMSLINVFITGFIPALIGFILILKYKK